MRVFVLDKDRALCELMTEILADEPDITLVGSGVSVAEAIAQVSACDMLLVSADLPCDDLFVLARVASEQVRPAQVILMDWERSQEAFRQYAVAGVIAYAQEDDSIQDLLDKMRALHAAKSDGEFTASLSRTPWLFDPA